MTEERELLAALEESNLRMVAAQTDLITFLRRQIDMMKTTCL